MTELEILNFYNDCHGTISPWERARFMERPEVITMATLDSAKVRRAIRMHRKLDQALLHALGPHDSAGNLLPDTWHSRGFRCPLHRISFCVECRPKSGSQSDDVGVAPPPEKIPKERKGIYFGSGPDLGPGHKNY